MEVPGWLPGGALEWPGYHPIKQPPLFHWLLERDAFKVAETELQCMYHADTPILIWFSAQSLLGLNDQGC